MKLSVVILNKDKPELIDTCLQSIFLHTKNIEFEVLVGDTGSRPEIFSEIYQNFVNLYPKQFRFFNLKKYHFSSNNNAVAKHAMGEKIVFLNNDTLLLDNAFSKLIQDWPQNSEIGIVGPKLVFGHNHKVQHAGIEFLNHPIYGVLAYHPYAGKHSSLSDVNTKKIMPAVTGACLAIDRADFEKVGGFDEAYVSEAQDVDLCLKISKLGKKTLYNGNVCLVHLENGSRPLGEENRSDRKLLLKKWKNKIHKDYLEQKFQFQYLLAEQQQQFVHSKKILFERSHARGDVLASLRICKKIKTQDPKCHITFKTAYPDLVDSSPYVDRVLSLNDLDTWTYDEHLLPTYEDGSWQKTDLKWIEQMAYSIGLEPHILDETMPLSFSSYDKLVAKNNRQGLEKYIVVSTGAGWQEREWSAEKWEDLSAEFNKMGYATVQIGGESDYQISTAHLRLNRNLQTNYEILQYAKGAVVLDSFSLHIAMMTETPVIVLTCKTCAQTVWLRTSTKELRNRWAKQTPLALCRDLGCRLKFGNGLDNPCLTPILKDLEAMHVLQLVRTHFFEKGDSFGN